MYMIRDMQFDLRYFADGRTYKSKKEVLDQLICFHSIDWGETTEVNEERGIHQYLKEEYNTNEERLDFMLDYGSWELVTAESEE